MAHTGLRRGAVRIFGAGFSAAALAVIAGTAHPLELGAVGLTVGIIGAAVLALAAPCAGEKFFTGQWGTATALQVTALISSLAFEVIFAVGGAEPILAVGVGFAVLIVSAAVLIAPSPSGASGAPDASATA